MPLASLQTCLALYHPNTMRRRPGIVFTEWLARATCRPWVMQASSKQVWGLGLMVQGQGFSSSLSTLKP